jgi:hypothetical protein
VPENPDMTEDWQAWEDEKARWRRDAKKAREDRPGGRSLTTARLQQKEARELAEARRRAEAQERDRRRAEARELAEARRRAEAQEREQQQWRRIEEQRGRFAAPWPVGVGDGRRRGTSVPPRVRVDGGQPYDARRWHAEAAVRDRLGWNEYGWGNADPGFYR